MIALIRTADRSYYGESADPLLPRYYWTATLLPSLAPSGAIWVAPVYLGGSLNVTTGELTGSLWTESSTFVPATQSDLASKVSKTGNETISGNKTFTGDTALNIGEALGLFEVLTALLTDNTQQAASTAFVKGILAKFGVGVVSPATSNVNTLTYSGSFGCTSTVTGLPVVLAGTLFNNQYQANASSQIYQTNSANRIFTRNQVNGVFGAWTELQKLPGAWTAITLSAGFTAGATVPSYRLRGNGVVEFRGRVVITSLLAANTLKTLVGMPVGYRPLYLRSSEPAIRALVNATTGVGCYASVLATGVLSLASTAGFAASDVIDITGLEYSII